MYLNRSSILGFSILVLGIAGAAVLYSQFPTVSLGGITVRTSFLSAVLVAGFLLLPTAISNYQSDKHRRALVHGLIAIGMPLVLLQYPVLPWVGLLAVLASVGISQKADRKIMNVTS